MRAPLAEGTREIKSAVDGHYDEDEYTIVPGDGWIGFYCFVPKSFIDFELVDRVRARGREVIAIDHGDSPGIYRFGDDGKIFERTRPDEVEAAHGVKAPTLPLSPGREERTAALVIGRTADEVRAVAEPGVDVQAGSRGVVALGPLAVLLDFHDQPDVTVYTVSHYLDNDMFSVTLERGTDTSYPTEVEGETDPRKIVAKLGIPVEYMFP
ncbi:MAG TPA: hypothetical protein VIV40_35140 [Kofleriaceae bacterium]